jgi:hypothetical protein
MEDVMEKKPQKRQNIRFEKESNALKKNLQKRKQQQKELEKAKENKKS